MASIPRIVAADSTDQIAGIVRGALTLLDRRYVLVEVPTATDALDELRNTQVDLLIASYALPDSNGIELAARAIRESAGTVVIILASASDPAVDPDILANVPYTYLVRPVGEQFLRALRIGLDGEAAVVANETQGGAVSTGLELGPVPEIDVKLLRDNLRSMLSDTGAIGAMVADRMGRVVHTEGVTGYFDKDKLAAGLGPGFARTVDFRELLGGNAWSFQFYDGENYDVFALALGLHYFVMLIFDGAKRPAYGPVISFVLKRVDSMIAEIGEEAAWSYRRTAAVVTQTTSAVKATATDKALPPAAQSSRNKKKTATTEVAAVAATTPEPALPPPPELKLEPVSNLDVDALFSQNVDETSFDDLFGEEDMQEKTFLSGNNMVSFDEAMNMGILDE